MIKCVFGLVMMALAGASYASEGALFRFSGEVYTPDKLSSRMSQLYGALKLEQHKALRTLIDEMVFDVYVAEQAKRQGRAIRDVGRELLSVPEPSDDQVANFYQQHQARIMRPLESVHDDLKKALQREAVLAKRAELLRRIKAEGGFELLARGPENISYGIDTRGRPMKGNPDAPITVVEFSDFQCPHCRQAASLIDKLLEQHPDMVKVYYMDYPLNRTGISREISHGGVCAAQQGKFWPYHDLAFSRQGTLNKSSPALLAAELELNVDQFKACLGDSSTQARVQASYEQGRRLGVSETPTVFVDSKPFVTNHFIRDMNEYIERKKAQGKG